jgi:hypothetical protein
MRCVKQSSFKFIFLITYESVNVKWNKQSYGAKLYFKLVLHKLKVMCSLTFIYTALGTSSKNNFHEGFHMPIAHQLSKEPSRKSFKIIHKL